MIVARTLSLKKFNMTANSTIAVGWRRFCRSRKSLSLSLEAIRARVLFTLVNSKAKPGKKCSNKTGAFLRRKGFEKKETKLCFFWSWSEPRLELEGSAMNKSHKKQHRPMF